MRVLLRSGYVVGGAFVVAWMFLEMVCLALHIYVRWKVHVCTAQTSTATT